MLKLVSKGPETRPVFIFSMKEQQQKETNKIIIIMETFCVFECTIVNLATYRRFTNAAWDWIIQKSKQNKTKAKKTKQNKTKNKKQKLH